MSHPLRKTVVESNNALEEREQTDGSVDGPGSQLRKARESLGLDQANIAARLHLSQSMIQALESDDYEKLPAAVFVQGHLRNYARLLGVKEDAVLRSHQELNPHSKQAPLQRNQPDDVVKELHGYRRLTRFTTWAVVAVLAVPLIFWWQGRMDLPEPESVQSATGSNSLPPKPGPAPAAVPPKSPVPPPEDESAAPQSAAAPPSEISSESPAIRQKTTPVLVEESAAPVASGMVVFEFSGPCWVEVRDTTGRARLIGEMREGLRRTLDLALGPFQVVLGDVNSVTVDVNGTKIDLRSHTRGKVARFTLDPSRL